MVFKALAQETTETGATKDIDAAVATEIVAAIEDNNEDDIEDNIEDNNNDDNEDDNEDNNKDNIKDNSEQNRFNNETKGTPNTLELQEAVHTDHTCKQNDATLFDWVVSSDNDNEEYQLYEHKEFKVLVDIIEAIVCTIEIVEKTSNDEQKGGRKNKKKKKKSTTKNNGSWKKKKLQKRKKRKRIQRTKRKKKTQRHRNPTTAPTTMAMHYVCNKHRQKRTKTMPFLLLFGSP